MFKAHEFTRNVGALFGTEAFHGYALKTTHATVSRFGNRIAFSIETFKEDFRANAMIEMVYRKKYEHKHSIGMTYAITCIVQKVWKFYSSLFAKG